jgi:hypothetical protein
VQFKSALANPTWSDLSGNVTAPGPVAAEFDPTIPTTQRFYRVILLP